MAINTYLSTIEYKNKINEQAEQKQTHRYREHFDGCQMGGGLGRWVKKVKGLRNTDWLLQNSHGDVKHNTENIVNDILITMYGARWAQDLSGLSLRKLCIV